MSFLAPLYAVGLLALSLPIVFHFIRRTPRGDYDFSTLMFLSPSPPRLTRRSRLDHILLLLLRGLVLVLLAFAFARPFLQETVLADAGQAAQHRVAIVLDTSASMRRDDLWQQAMANVISAIDDCRPFDEMAVFLCDESLRPLAGFEEVAQLQPAERRALVERRFRSLSPTWAATNLGQGLMDAAQIINDMPAGDPKAAARVTPRIVLVSDLQEGSRLEALADYQWPADVRIKLLAVRAAKPTNAGLHGLESRTPDAPAAAGAIRVRVSNDATSAADQFQLGWSYQSGQKRNSGVEVSVPAGESRVTRVPRPDEQGTGARLVLRGDEHDFDNTLYLADSVVAERTIGYIGNEAADDPQGLRYYVERAAAGIGPGVRLIVEQAGGTLPFESPNQMPLVIITSPPGAEQAGDLKAYLQKGGTFLYVVTDADQSSALAALLDIPSVSVAEASVDGYSMLGRIAFDHPLFAPMAGLQFNDFTQIHFWKYRRIDAAQIKDANVVAQFENGDPAIIERKVGKGALCVFTSGWHPGDSQLARSWKFVSLLATLAHGHTAIDLGQRHFRVNDAIPLTGFSHVEQPLVITKPDGKVVTLPDGAQTFTETDQPGIYSIDTSNGPQHFAVNLAASESKTVPLEIETLEQLGLPLANRKAEGNNEKLRERLHDAQLESRQKIWQWLIAAALGLVVAETWLAGRLSRPSNTEVNPA